MRIHILIQPQENFTVPSEKSKTSKVFFSIQRLLLFGQKKSVIQYLRQSSMN